MALRDALSFDTKGFGQILLALPALAIDDLKVEGDTRRARRASKRAVIAQIQRWRLWVQQGVPLRDEAALMHFARLGVFRDQRGHHHPAASRKAWSNSDASMPQIINSLAVLAGGTLPIGFEQKALTILRDLRASQEAKEELRATARHSNKATPIGMDPTVKTHDRTRDLLVERANSAIQQAEFTCGLDKNDWSMESPFDYSTGEWSLRPRECVAEYRKKGITSRRSSYSTVFVPTIGWLNRVGLKDRANLFGYRTLVLDWVELPDKGIIVTMARQKSEHRYTIETVRGQYSLDSDSNPKLVDEVVLSVSKMADLKR